MARKDDATTPPQDVDALLRGVKRRLWGAYYAARKAAETCPTPGEMCPCTLIALDAEAAVVAFANDPAVIAAAAPRTSQV